MSTPSELLLEVVERATGTFTLELSYDETPPGPNIPANQVINGTGTIHWGGYFWVPDARVPSTWPYVTCVAKDGYIRAEFSATRATWPTSWPDSATCSFEGYGLELATVTVDLVPCTTDRCRREDRDTSVMPRCSFPWNLETGGGITSDGCALPPPPHGQVYDVPDEATNTGGAHWEWSTRRRVGLLASPETDPVVEGVTCGILLWEQAEQGSFFVVDADTPPDDVRAYCPMRYRSLSTGERWWGPEAILGIDRY